MEQQEFHLQIMKMSSRSPELEIPGVACSAFPFETTHHLLSSWRLFSVQQAGILV